MWYSLVAVVMTGLIGTSYSASNASHTASNSLNHTPTTPTPGIYEHYKGKYYEVFGTCHHTETMEELVVYRALYEAPRFGALSVWCRPTKMFMETVTTEDGEEKPRFRRVCDRPSHWF